MKKFKFIQITFINIFLLYLSFINTIKINENNFIIKNKINKRKTFISYTAPISLDTGQVSNSFHEIPIPKRPIAIYRFEADIVEKDPFNHNNYISVPLYDAYLHHHVVFYYNKDHPSFNQRIKSHHERPLRFGAGVESRGTPQMFSFPYAFLTRPNENLWYANVHIINTRNFTMENAYKCLECPCHFENNFRKNTFYNNYSSIGKNCNNQLIYDNNTACFVSTYHGGLHCCKDKEYCIINKEMKVIDKNIQKKAKKSIYFLRYIVEYDFIVPENKELYLATCCDATGDILKRGAIEYDIPKCNKKIHPGCIHTLSTIQLLDKTFHNNHYDPTNDTMADPDREVEIVYAVGHQHRSGLGIFIYNERNGHLICSSIPTYGNGTLAGNENGYVVAMSSCSFSPPLRMKASDKIRIVSLYNNTESHTGVMSLFYISIYDVQKKFLPTLQEKESNYSIKYNKTISTFMKKKKYHLTHYLMITGIALFFIFGIIMITRFTNFHNGYHRIPV